MRKKALFFLFVLAAPTFAEAPGNAEAPGKANSDALFASLLRGGLSPVAQYFAEPNDGFPYNILLPFDPGTDGDSAPPTLLLVFSQEEWAERIERLTDFLLQFQQSSPAVRTVFLLSAGDNPLIRPSPQGSQIYLEQGDGIDNTAMVALVVLLNTEFQRPPQVLPGTTAITAPLALIRQIPFPIAGRSTAFYRFGLAGEERRLEVFRDEEIPAAAIVVNPDYNDGIASLFQGLAPLINSFAFPDPTKADMNYSLFPNAYRSFYAGERGFLMAYLLYLAAAILFLCIHRHQDLQYLPLFLAATFASLILGTAVIHAITGPTAGILFPIVLRILVPFLLFSFLSIYLRRTFPNVTFEYGHLLFLQALVNLCVFGSLDFFLLVVFVILFFIAQFVRHSHRRASFLLVGILSFCIYLPLITAIVQNGDRDTLYQLANTGVLFPAIASLLILPFLLMWLEILKGLKWPVVVTSGVAILFLAGGFLGSRFISLRNAPRYSALPSFPRGSADENTAPGVTVNTSREFFFDEYEVVTVTAQSGLPLICLDMLVTTADAPAFLTSSSPFAAAVTESSLSFLPPELPPNPLSFTYTVPRGTATEVHAAFYLLDEDSTIVQKNAMVNREMGMEPYE